MEQLKTLGNGRPIDGLLHYLRDFQSHDDLAAALNEGGGSYSSSSDAGEPGERSRLLGGGGEPAQLPCSKAAVYGMTPGSYSLEGRASGDAALRMEPHCHGVASAAAAAAGGDDGAQGAGSTQGQRWNLRFMARVGEVWGEFDRRYMQPTFGGPAPEFELALGPRPGSRQAQRAPQLGRRLS